MSMMGRIIYITFFGGVIALGFSIIVVNALPYILDKNHVQITDILHYQCDPVPCAGFIIKLDAMDIFSANNPINVSVHTGACSPSIKSIQLTFKGASTYFPGDYDLGSSDFWDKEYDEMRTSIESNILHLVRATTMFSGEKKGLKYNNGGQFDIGITLTLQDGTVLGDGVGDKSYVIMNAVKISPPEALLQLKQTNASIGLAWVALGIGLLAIGAGAIIELLIKHYV